MRYLHSYMHACMHVRHMVLCLISLFQEMYFIQLCQDGHVAHLAIPTAKKQNGLPYSTRGPVCSVKPYHNGGGISRLPLTYATCNQRFGVVSGSCDCFVVLLQCLNGCQSWCIFNLGHSITNSSYEACFQVIFSQNCVEMDRFHMWKEMPLLIVPCLSMEISCWYILTLYTIKI